MLKTYSERNFIKMFSLSFSNLGKPTSYFILSARPTGVLLFLICWRQLDAVAVMADGTFFKTLLRQLCVNVTIQKSDAVWVTHDSLCHVWHLAVKLTTDCSEIFRKVFPSQNVVVLDNTRFVKLPSVDYCASY